MRTLFSILLITITLSLAAALAPLYGVGRETTIPDEYIVVLNENFTVEMRDAHISELQAVLSTVQIKHFYAIEKFIAFAAVMDKSALARELEHPDVKLIEANGIVQIYADDAVTQDGAEWGLGRICQRDIQNNNKYTYFESAGSGVDMHIIDTGCNCDHDDFQTGRCTYGGNFIPGESVQDCNGHGTHVASTAAGRVYGVAKRANIVCTKCLACSGSGSYDGVIAAIQWVLNYHKAKAGRRSVANMSLGGGKSTTVDQAANQAVAGGVCMVVAAGNNGLNACNYSPAGATDVMTVGSTQLGDQRSSFSNIGNCVDIFAPGSAIKGAWWTSNSAVNTISGTSMASPHVAGACAIRLGHQLATTPSATPYTPAEVFTYLKSVATKDKITSVGANSPNSLLFSTSTNP